MVARRNYQFFFSINRQIEAKNYCTAIEPPLLLFLRVVVQETLEKSKYVKKRKKINCRWILVVISIKERTITVIGPLVQNTMWADASARKGVQVGLEIMRWKFNVQVQHMTKVKITHVKQPNAISCGAMVCYYAEKIINNDIFLFYVCTLHRRIQTLVKHIRWSFLWM